MLPDPTDLYIPEELGRRRLQNLAEEHIADQEERLRREDSAVPEKDVYISRCMQLWSAEP